MYPIWPTKCTTVFFLIFISLVWELMNAHKCVSLLDITFEITHYKRLILQTHILLVQLYTCKLYPNDIPLDIVLYQWYLDRCTKVCQVGHRYPIIYKNISVDIKIVSVMSRITQNISRSKVKRISRWNLIMYNVNISIELRKCVNVFRMYIALY